jgi:hypothetical protein
MPSKHPVERGQRYRDLSTGRFGALGTEWIVDAIFIGTDGIQYAQMVNAADLTLHKTLAVDVLSDRKRWAQWGRLGQAGGHQAHASSRSNFFSWKL